MLQFGIRGLFGSVSPIEQFRVDQMVLAVFLAPAALGLYVVGLAFTNVLRFLSESVGMVAYPSIAAHEDRDAGRRSMWSFVWLAAGLSAIIVVPLMVAAHWLVPLLFGDEFRDAVLITEILLPGMCFAGARRVLAYGLRGRGHPGAGTLAEVAAWVWLAPSLGVLVPVWGVNGAAAALSGSYVVSLGALLLLAVRRGEARLPIYLSSPPRAAWDRLRLFSASRSR
jgi:O-antigen/teichoic acid export membrane protein